MEGPFDETACTADTDIDETDIEDGEESENELWLNARFLNGILTYRGVSSKC